MYQEEDGEEWVGSLHQWSKPRHPQPNPTACVRRGRTPVLLRFRQHKRYRSSNLPGAFIDGYVGVRWRGRALGVNIYTAMAIVAIEARVCFIRWRLRLRRRLRGREQCEHCSHHNRSVFIWLNFGSVNTPWPARKKKEDAYEHRRRHRPQKRALCTCALCWC